jgi:hypothetical protein
MEENEMNLDKMKTEELIEFYKKIQDFLKFLEKEEQTNQKQ